ncbi:MAG: glycosyltransferase [Betaproteobacteria bacterium]|nr:glycosyltransferase [Betaproteobacteria bacterium]MDH5307329.1 glycosyltransferase [Myxococcales bacterium]
MTGESDFSGGEVQVFLLMEGLRARGHRNVLVCPPGSASAREAERRKFACVCARMRNDLSLLGARRIHAHLRRCRPDLVHLHTGRADWLGGLAAWRLSLPALSTRRMDRPVRRGPRTRFVYGRALRRIVAISPAVRERLAAAGIPEEKTRVIWSAVDPGALEPRAGRADTRAREGLADDTPCLLALASLVARKGIDVLIDAVSLLGDTDLRPTLWIAGDGPERPALERRARARGLAQRVRFLGRRSDVADLLAACDVFVLPSRREGLGVAALEAMAAARPVIASDVGGLGEAVVHERTGLLVPPGDAAALRGALARLLGDAPLRKRLGDAGPVRVRERFTADRMVEAYEALYHELLAEGAPG